MSKCQFAIFLLYFHYVKICILMVYTRSNFHVSVITLFCGLTCNNSVVIFHCSMVATLTSAGLVNDKLLAYRFWINSGFTYLENVKLSADWLSWICYFLAWVPYFILWNSPNNRIKFQSIGCFPTFNNFKLILMYFSDWFHMKETVIPS